MSMQTPNSTGLVANMRCPWCQEKESLEDIDEQLEVGSVIECTGCGGLYEITAIATVKQLWASGVEDAKMQ